jgi:signal transduction histidine kinase
MSKIHPRSTRWLTGLLAAVVVAINVAGIGGIAIARRTALEEAHSSFQEDVDERVRALTAQLASIRSDLSFLAALSPVAQLDEAAEERVVAGRRTSAEGAFLFFLRAHPEVVRVLARSPTGLPLVHTGRRGGVPVLWVSANPTGLEGAAVSPDRPRLTTTYAFDASGDAGAGKFTLETEIEPSSLFSSGPRSASSGTCRIVDAKDRLLARQDPHGAVLPPDTELAKAAAAIDAGDWSAPSPWRMLCERPAGQGGGRVEALAARYRATLRLNIGVMAATLLLGGLAVFEARRRERMEARAREEGRVRELERQLFHAERLTTVGRLAAGIAHEINNPLEGMANWLSLAKQSLEYGDIRAAQQHVGRVREGLDRAAGIVRQVLAHSDPAKAPHEPTDLNQILRETHEFVKSRKEFGNVAFASDLLAGALLVRGSPVMLGQVAVNLILNACEAQPSGGEVRLSSRREGTQAVAEFSDRGPGIAEADRDRVFEPFFSTKDSTGLGLSICHSIVQQHGGELRALPRAGGGTVFRMTLPALEG